MTGGNRAGWLRRTHGGVPGWLAVLGVLLAGVLVWMGVFASASRTVPPWTPPPEAASPSATAAAAPVAVFLGDSYTAGAGSDGVGWTTIVAREQGWVEMNLARGGTGFLATSGPEGCGLAYCPSIPEMVTVAAELEPDVVVVSAGRNDGTADNAAAIADTFTALRGALPGTRIIAVAPLWDDTGYPGFLVTMGATIRDAVEGVGGEYLGVGTPLEGRPELVDTDGVHPNAAGHAAIGAAVNEALGT